MAGVRRITKFAKFLPQHGFRPIVLASVPDSRKTQDLNALKDIEHTDIAVYRCKSFDTYGLTNSLINLKNQIPVIKSKFDLSAPPPGEKKNKTSPFIQKANNAIRRLVSFPDDRLPWLLTAIPMVDQIMRNHPIRYVITSSFPHSSHLIGLYLKNRYNIHWHADFRDGWMQNPYFADWLTPLHRQFSQKKEREVVEKADTVTAVSSPITNYLRSLTSRPEKVFTLSNGFDRDDFESIEPEEFDCYTVAYTGTLFMHRSPQSFFQAVRDLIDNHPGLEGNFQVIFQSNIKPEHREMLDKFHLAQMVKFRPIGTYEEALRLQKSADLLLVLEGESENSEIMLTQKIFEYMAAEKPVLAVAPEGALADVVRLTGCGKVVSPTDVYRITETLYEFFMERITLRRNEDEIGVFSRAEQTKELVKILKHS